MEASGFPTPEHDEGEERDVRSDLETLKKLYGLLDKKVGINTESNNEEILDHKSRIFLMKLLDEATQHTIRHQIKMLPKSTNDGLEQNHNNCLRHSVQRGDSNLLKSQFSVKSRQNQAHHEPNQVSSLPYHPMSRYHGRSGIDWSSRPLIGGIPMHQCQKERSLYCPSELEPNSNAFKTAELTPKRILASLTDRTNTTLRPVRPDRVSSRPEHMDLQVVPYKMKNQNVEPEKDCSSDGTTSSRESKSRMLDQRKTNEINKRIPIHKRLSVIDRKKKAGDNLQVVSSCQSNSGTSSEFSQNSSSPSKRRLPMVIQKSGHPLGATHSKRHLISQHDHNKSLQRIQSKNSLSSPKQRLPMIVLKPGHPLGATRSKRQLISQNDNNKPLQRIHGTRQELVSLQRNWKKQAKETDTPEQKKGRLERLKEKLAIVLHPRHDHRHNHHHQSGEDEASKGRAKKHHHHRSLLKYLKGIVHPSIEQTAEIVPSQHHQHRDKRALFRMLFGHLWINRQRKKARLGKTVSRGRVKKLHWWQKFRRGGPTKLTNGRNSRLRLPGAKGRTKK